MSKMDESRLPAEYRPLSPWAYFGLTILFSVPVLGTVFLIIFSISRANINRRNFARSYFCVLALILIVTAICIACGVSLSVLDRATSLFR